MSRQGTAAYLVLGGVLLAGSGGISHLATGSKKPAAAEAADIPAHYQRLYQQAATTCPGLDWATLAAVGKVETNHGRSDLPGVRSGENYAGAGGPMQFLSPTYASVRADHPDIGPDRYDPRNAIPAAAHYLCDSGASTGDISSALYTYNHSSQYVAQVQRQAAAYRGQQ